MDIVERKRSAAALSVAALLVWLFIGACDRTNSGERETADTGAAQKPDPPERQPSIPAQPGDYSPAMTKLVEGAHYDLDTHTDVETCTECHAEIVGQWRESVHGLASMANPYYRQAFDQFVEEAGRDKANFCAGCHDPALLFDGAIEREVDPSKARAFVGITCNTCHGVVETTLDGNGSYTLSTAPVPIPKDGDDESLKKHLERVGQPVLRTNRLCISCHKAFLSPDTGHDVVIAGMTEFTFWRRSPYNDNQTARITDGIVPKGCTDCHMPEVGPDGLKSHRFAGGHSSLAAVIGSDEQLDAVEKMVQSAALLDVAAFGVGEKIEIEKVDQVEPGERLWVDVVVHNDGTGHRFPGGALDLRDTWVELEVKDADGEVVASAGDAYEEGTDDISAHKLRALISTPEGQKVPDHQVHQFRTPAYNNTITSSDAQVVRYAWQVPKDAKLKHPLTIEAKLRHRRLTPSFHEQACEASKTDRAKEFREGAKKFMKVDVDPCAEQPILLAGKAKATVGGEDRSPALPAWRRYYLWGLGLQHHLQESLDEATVAFEKALEELGESGEKRHRAMVLLGLGQVAGRQGRTQEAMDFFAKAEKLIGAHPAIHYSRGAANHRVFQLEEAVKWFQKAGQLQDDDRIWRDLAIAAGSVSKNRLAYDAALRGLQLEGRDPHLLRSQMLALRNLDAPEKWREAAKEAFLDFKRDEMAPEIKSRCSSGSEECQLERIPVHVHELTSH